MDFQKMIDDAKAALQSAAAEGSKVKTQVENAVKNVKIDTSKPAYSQPAETPESKAITGTLFAEEPDDSNMLYTWDQPPLDYTQAGQMRPYLPTVDEFFDAYTNEPDASRRQAIISIYGNYSPLGRLPLTASLLNQMQWAEKYSIDTQTPRDYVGEARTLRDLVYGEVNKFNPGV